MEDFLIDFLEQPLNKTDASTDDAGPVITISRECGCSSQRIAVKLAKILSGYSFQHVGSRNQEWKWVNKEVIEKAALALNISNEKIKGVLQQEAKLSLHNVTTAFSTEKIYDADDQQVIDTLTEVIRNLAIQGHYVIVGRAANIIAEDIKAKLRIKLQAPLLWRVNRIRENSNMSFTVAQDYVLEVDRQRELMVQHIAGRKLANYDFDLIFNCATFTDDQIIDTILQTIKCRNMI